MNISDKVIIEKNLKIIKEIILNVKSGNYASCFDRIEELKENNIKYRETSDLSKKYWWFTDTLEIIEKITNDLNNFINLDSYNISMKLGILQQMIKNNKIVMQYIKFSSFLELTNQVSDSKKPSVNLIIKHMILEVWNTIALLYNELFLRSDNIIFRHDSNDFIVDFHCDDPEKNEIYLIMHELYYTLDHLSEFSYEEELKFIYDCEELIYLYVFFELLLFGEITDFCKIGIFKHEFYFDKSFQEYAIWWGNKHPTDIIDQWYKIDYEYFGKFYEALRSKDYDFTALKKQMNDTINHIKQFSTKVILKRKEHEIRKHKEDERNRILSNLSHSIKNMLRSVIDPLLLIKQEIPEKSGVIDSAIKGANLIREIVNSINISYTVTIDDLLYDVTHQDKDSVSLREMLTNGLQYSISNMFDSKYFPAYMQNYFPQRTAYLRANQKWEEIIRKIDLDSLCKFTSENMFRLVIQIDDSADYIVGNIKSSAVKLMILFQEMIFNAVKYTSYAPKTKRQIEINLNKHDEKLMFQIKNSYKPEIKAKTTGVGLLVIENFAKVLGCEPMIKMENGIYSISIEFNDFWRKDA